MVSSPTFRARLSFAGGLLLGGGLLLAPPAVTTRSRQVLRDAARPGLTALQFFERQLQALADTSDLRSVGPPRDDDESHPKLKELEQLRIVNRQLQLAVARLTSEQEAAPAVDAPYLAEQGQPLFLPELISAEVIGQAIALREYDRLINQGAAAGLSPRDLVLPTAEGQVLIDQGQNVSLQADQVTLAGRCVLGKLDEVGQQTSTILPITHARFRGRAQLIRHTPQGARHGPEGVLAGDGGQHCRLTLVATTAAVAVGDDVYTSTAEQMFTVPLYYGRVVSAVSSPGEPYWEILVAPAASLADARTVQVLRPRVNPVRLTSASDEVLHP